MEKYYEKAVGEGMGGLFGKVKEIIREQVDNMHMGKNVKRKKVLFKVIVNNLSDSFREYLSDEVLRSEQIICKFEQILFQGKRSHY